MHKVLYMDGSFEVGRKKFLMTLFYPPQSNSAVGCGHTEYEIDHISACSTSRCCRK